MEFQISETNELKPSIALIYTAWKWTKMKIHKNYWRLGLWISMTNITFMTDNFQSLETLSITTNWFEFLKEIITLAAIFCFSHFSDH